MPAEKYDKWYNAARLRDEADWLVGVNARRALAFAAGRGTYRIGRTSASVLKMIADRNIMVGLRNRTTERHTTVAVKDRNGNIFALHSIEPNCVTANATSEVKIISVEKNENKVRTPKLYNLINLQIDAARLFGMTPLRTYEAALRLFGRKLISYPVAAGSTVLSVSIRSVARFWRRCSLTATTPRWLWQISDLLPVAVSIRVTSEHTA